MEEISRTGINLIKRRESRFKRGIAQGSDEIARMIKAVTEGLRFENNANLIEYYPRIQSTFVFAIFAHQLEPLNDGY